MGEVTRLSKGGGDDEPPELPPLNKASQRRGSEAGGQSSVRACAPASLVEMTVGLEAPSGSSFVVAAAGGGVYWEVAASGLREDTLP